MVVIKYYRIVPALCPFVTQKFFARTKYIGRSKGAKQKIEIL